ncbi:hypothetical protein SAMN05444355_103279 [Flavobacterium frigoris]|uniref:Uncharacterized protein n=1 Tax=Flavobacterium frigoris TaxID=229204 RepID=A0A1H9HWF6_FLAFI|nr:hypothetical protein SAMN05444355_103279 [Flavobacterium frigoris]
MTVIIIIGILTLLRYTASIKKEAPLQNTNYSDSNIKVKK